MLKILLAILIFIASVTGLLVGLDRLKTQHRFSVLINKLNKNKTIYVVLFLASSLGILAISIINKPENKSTINNYTYFNGEVYEKSSRSETEKEFHNIAASFASEAYEHYLAAEKYFEDNEYSRAAEYYLKSINISPSMSSYLNLGVTLLIKGNYDKALEAVDEGLSLSNKSQNRNMKAKFLLNKARIFMYDSCIQDAIKYYYQALEIETLLGNQNNILIIQCSLANAMAQLGKDKLALEFCIKGLRKAEETNDTLGKVLANKYMGRHYYKKWEWEEALKYYSRAYEIQKKAGIYF